MIIGNKTILRPWAADDLPILQSLRNDFRLQQQLMALSRPNSIEQVKEWLANRTKSSDSVFFVIATKQSDRAIGYLQVVQIDSFNGSGRFGICISPEEQGKGYGSEAITLVESYLRDVLRLRKLVLEVLANNRARHLYSKLGFTEVGCLRDHFYIDNKLLDVAIMEKFI